MENKKCPIKDFVDNIDQKMNDLLKNLIQDHENINDSLSLQIANQMKTEYDNVIMNIQKLKEETDKLMEKKDCKKETQNIIIDDAMASFICTCISKDIQCIESMKKEQLIAKKGFENKLLSLFEPPSNVNNKESQK